jgi:hypothetical protein
MTTEVQELQPGEIDRSGITSNAPAQHVEQQAPAAPMAPEQAAAVAHIGELRKQAADPALTYEQRAVIIEKMSALSKHAWLGAKAPAWYSAKSEAPPPDMRTLAEAADDLNLGSYAPMNDREHEHFVRAGNVQGLNPAVSNALAGFVHDLGMPAAIANIILGRAVRHYAADGEYAALDSIPKLTEADRKEYYEAACAAVPGGSVAYEKLVDNAEQALRDAGLLEQVERSGIFSTSLAFDPRVLNAIILFAKTRAK